MLLLFLFVSGVSHALFTPLLSVFALDFVEGASLSAVGFSFTIFAIVKTIFQMPLARKIDKGLGEYADLLLMVIGGVFMTFATFMLVGVTEMWQIYIVQAFLGIGGASTFSAYYAFFAKHTDKGKEAFEWSLFSVGGLTISLALGSLLGGIIADTLGFRLLFAISAILSLIATVLLLLIYPHLKEHIKKAEKASK